MEENCANDNNTILGVSLLSNGNILDLAKCTCLTKANRHFIIYKVAKNLNVQKSPSTSLLAAHGQVNNSIIFESNIFEFECK